MAVPRDESLLHEDGVALETERAIVDIHVADYLLTLKGNCPDTLATLTALDWKAPATRHHDTEPEKAHRRVDTRSLPQGLLRFEHARQALRVTRERTCLKTSKTTSETTYAITSVAHNKADPEQLLLVPARFLYSSSLTPKTA